MKTRAKAMLAAGMALGIFLAYFFYFRPASHELILYGNVDQRQIDLAFSDSERVAEVLVEEGEVVAPGQVLARLETRRQKDRIAVLEARVQAVQVNVLRLKNGTRPEEIEQARAALASAQAEVDFAQASYNRLINISKTSGSRAVSPQDIDQAKLRLNISLAKYDQQQKALHLAEIGPRQEDITQAEAQLRESELTLAEAQNRLADMELKSPAASVVRSRMLEPGDMASPQRAVFSLAVLSPKWIRAYIAESYLGNIRPGMEALVHTDSHPNNAITGRVGFISSVAEFTPKTVQTPELRTALVYEIRIYVEDKDDRLRLGMPATVSFPGLPSLAKESSL